MAARAYFGTVGGFDSTRETFSAYVERFELFFEANDLVLLGGAGNNEADAATGRKRKAIFLTEIGAEVFTLLSTVLSPRKPKDVNLDTIIGALKKHYNPDPLEIAESFHFGTRNRNSGESVAEYVVALKKLAIHCNFGKYRQPYF